MRIETKKRIQWALAAMLTLLIGAWMLYVIRVDPQQQWEDRVEHATPVWTGLDCERVLVDSKGDALPPAEECVARREYLSSILEGVGKTVCDDGGRWEPSPLHSGRNKRRSFGIVKDVDLIPTLPLDEMLKRQNAARPAGQTFTKESAEAEHRAILESATFVWVYQVVDGEGNTRRALPGDVRFDRELECGR